MGCVSSKQVQVVKSKQLLEKEAVDGLTAENAVAEQPSAEGTTSSSSCIDQESRTLRECHGASDSTGHNEAQSDDDDEAANITSGDTNSATECYVPPQGKHDMSSDKRISLAELGCHLSSNNYRIDYRQLFQIIKAAVYINDIQQITRLRNDIEMIKSDIQTVAFRNGGDLPPIPEGDTNLDNPRRVQPSRNQSRENAANLALEVSTAYRILENGGLYKKDFVEIEELKAQYGRLQDYLKVIYIG